MTNSATSARHAPESNPVRDLPLHDLAGFTHRWVDADGVRLHAVEGGRPDGPAVVLLAGFPQTWWAWRKVMPDLAGRFHVIAIDLPGQGHSERPEGSYDTHTVAAHVHAAVDALGVPTYWLAGHDIGAWVAFSLALNYESRLRGLALLDAGIPGITLPAAIPLDLNLAWKTWHFAFHLVPGLPEVLLAGREREYVGWFLNAKALTPGAFDDAEVDHYAAALATDPLINTATASDPNDPDGASGSDSDVRKASTGLTVTKDDGSTSYTPGGTATYTIVVTNAGPSAANAISVDDPLPPGVTLAGAVTCTVAGSGNCGSITGGIGGGAFSATGAQLAAGAGNSLTYTLPVQFAASMQDDPLANSVLVTDPSDPQPHTGTDSDVAEAQARVNDITRGRSTAKRLD